LCKKKKKFIEAEEMRGWRNEREKRERRSSRRREGARSMTWRGNMVVGAATGRGRCQSG